MRGVMLAVEVSASRSDLVPVPGTDVFGQRRDVLVDEDPLDGGRVPPLQGLTVLDQAALSQCGHRGPVALVVPSGGGQAHLHRGPSEQAAVGRVVRKFQRPPLRSRARIEVTARSTLLVLMLRCLVQAVDHGQGALLPVVELGPGGQRFGRGRGPG
ncbi:hypothetical protein [Nonomuraea sp. NPDC049684]|uniref:hypothetical protein n=1 Tax=Nonomuraea sp. NPDC049684 TaxID=3364356 RepID=UPI0037BAF534